MRDRLIELLDNTFAIQYDKRGVITAHHTAEFLSVFGVTVQEWISVKDRTPTEADGTVWVCLADVFPYNKKEPYPNAKHDGRITEAHYSEFSNKWYKDGAVFHDGIVTHWMEKPQPPKGE